MDLVNLKRVINYHQAMQTDRKIETGCFCPLFSLPIAQGGNFELGKSLLTGPVIANFIRGTWCEFCTDHLKKIQEWKKNVLDAKGLKSTVVVISSEPRERILEYLTSHPMPFLFLYDELGRVAKLYGLQQDQDEYSRPGMVLIDSDRRIRLIDDGFRNSETLKETGEICESCEKI